ncbi:MAG TPA: DMT family transporter [Gemmatimonadales bacterium]|nr:DMT family transporter [Gemmatimonadales bacterium]
MAISGPLSPYRSLRSIQSLRLSSGLAWMALAQLCFAGMNICTRLGARSLSWAEVASARFLVGGIIAAGLGWLRGSSLRVGDQPAAWRRSIYGTLAAICAFYALASSRIALGDAATLGATAPIFVVLFAGPLLGERVSAGELLAVALGFTGVIAVMRPSFALAGPVAAIATVGAMFWALAMIWVRKMGAGESHEAVVLHFSLVALLTFLLLALPQWRWPSWTDSAFLLGAGLGGGLGQVTMTRAYSLHRAAPVSALSALSLVLTYALALPVFGDRPTAWQVGGSLLVVSASVLLAVSHDRQEAPVRT